MYVLYRTMSEEREEMETEGKWKVEDLFIVSWYATRCSTDCLPFPQARLALIKLASNYRSDWICDQVLIPAGWPETM